MLDQMIFQGPFQPALFCDSLEASKPCEVMKSLAGMIPAINIWPLAKQFTYLRDKWPCYGVTASEYSLEGWISFPAPFEIQHLKQTKMPT